MKDKEKIKAEVVTYSDGVYVELFKNKGDGWFWCDMIPIGPANNQTYYDLALKITAHINEMQTEFKLDD